MFTMDFSTLRPTSARPEFRALRPLPGRVKRRQLDAEDMQSTPISCKPKATPLGGASSECGVPAWLSSVSEARSTFKGLMK